MIFSENGYATLPDHALESFLGVWRSGHLRKPSSDRVADFDRRPKKHIPETIQETSHAYFDELVAQRAHDQRQDQSQNHECRPEQPAINPAIDQLDPDHLQRKQNKRVDEIEAVADLAELLQRRRTQGIAEPATGGPHHPQHKN